ncbi:Peptidase S54, rhomboid domain protein [Thalassoporum mexicanum PCC 7367]|uniref:rhomboid family intramembrane serine protease n=1 Tax=Thalassoporum mexicanum TaxID=3457544 RepID=UPI00029FCD65|nr:rhomboid family intramembrane serine protease [Pseudanabaena sp. PCC 7367]AFY69039.1 Peptidase S54, rhomboid domain protein [Pseudanabaena sp. PCC 7367]
MNDRNIKDLGAQVGKELKTQVTILGGFVAIIWIVQIINAVIFRGYLAQFGIIPLHIVGLRGIFLAPFLHGNFAHVAANTLPFLILGWLVIIRGVGEFFFVSVFAALIAGIGTWLIGGSNTVHVGASGMIFGYFGYLLLRGVFERNVISIVISVIVGITYGSLIFGVAPTEAGVSWQGHLFGFIGGAIAAKLLANQKKSDRSDRQY